MTWLSKLLARRAAAKEALKIVEKMLESGQDAIELASRLKRDAKVGDLQDSLQRFQSLHRKAKNG